MSFGVSGLAKRVETLFSSWAQHDAPGGAVIVIHEGEVLHEGFWGLADLKTKRPLGPKSSFRLASLTKQFTALAIVMLAEKGLLTYDDDIRNILGEFSSYPRRISISHLLHHTSGLQDFDFAFSSLPNCVERERPTSRTAQVSELMSTLARNQLRFTPGEEWEYSNSGYVALAQIVERVSGTPYAEFMKEQIFQPLQMKNSFVVDKALFEPPLRVRGYIKNQHQYQEFDYTPFDGLYGHDGIYSTAEDIVNWCLSFHRGSVLPSTRLANSFRTGYLNSGANIGYGCGWFVGKLFDFETVSHTGSWTGYRHLLVHYPQLKFTLLILSNCAEFDDVSRSATAIALARLFLSDKITPPVEAKVSTKILQKYVGRYQFMNGEYIDLRLEGGSLLIAPEGLFPLRLTPESAVKFLVVGAEGDSYFFHTGEKDAVLGLTRHLSLFGYSRDAFCDARRID